MHTHGRRPQSTGRARAPLAFLRLRWARPLPAACTSSLRSESPPLRWPCTLRRFTYASVRCAMSSLTRRTRQSAVAPPHVQDVGHAGGARAPRSHGGHTRGPAKAMPGDPRGHPAQVSALGARCWACAEPSVQGGHSLREDGRPAHHCGVLRAAPGRRPRTYAAIPRVARACCLRHATRLAVLRVGPRVRLAHQVSPTLASVPSALPHGLLMAD